MRLKRTDAYPLDDQRRVEILSAGHAESPGRRERIPVNLNRHLVSERHLVFCRCPRSRLRPRRLSGEVTDRPTPLSLSLSRPRADDDRGDDFARKKKKRIRENSSRKTILFSTREKEKRIFGRLKIARPLRVTPSSTSNRQWT